MAAEWEDIEITSLHDHIKTTAIYRMALAGLHLRTSRIALLNLGQFPVGRLGLSSLVPQLLGESDLVFGQ